MPGSAVREGWSGVEKLRNLVVFGASYCDIGYNARKPHPSPERPLGVDFPGKTWCGQYDKATNSYTYQPNWVGHLVQLLKERRGDIPLLVYDYALGGDRVDGVARQVHQEFLPHLAPKPDWASWSPDDTLFVTWVGINDCSWNKGRPDPAESCRESIRALFALHQELYDVGARNFCLIDVPPTYDYPSDGLRPQKLHDAVLSWNTALNEAAANFGAEHADATVVVWSSWKLFTDLLANPASYGFSQEETAKAEGAIFEDGLHPTTAVHRLIARELLEFLYTLHRSD